MNGVSTFVLMVYFMQKSSHVFVVVVYFKRKCVTQWGWWLEGGGLGCKNMGVVEAV